MNTEMDDIYRLAISNMATGLQDLEDRVEYLEGQLDKPAPYQTAFDLSAYKAKLEQRLRECETQYPTYTIDIMQSRVAGQIDAYKHSLKLLEQ